MIAKTAKGTVLGWIFFLWQYTCTFAMYPILFTFWVITLIKPISWYGEAGIDMLLKWWQAHASSLIENVYGVRLDVYGDALIGPSPGKKHVIMSNHRTRVDFYLIFHLLHKARYPAQYIKIMLKKVFLFVPAAGAVMAMSRFMFVTRNAEIDVPNLRMVLNRIKRSVQPALLFIQPEAYTYTEKTVNQMNKYAADNNKQPFQKVLIPRPSGMHTALEIMGSDITDVYDVTLGYHDILKDTESYTEFDFTIGGKMLTHVSMLVKRYNAAEIPREKEALQNWLYEVWVKKDQSLIDLHETGKFINTPVQKVRRSGLWALVRFNLINLMTIVLLYYSTGFCIFFFVSLCIPVALDIIGIPCCLIESKLI